MESSSVENNPIFYALTVMELFATYIIHGPKRLENRTYPLDISSLIAKSGASISNKGVWIAIHVSSSKRNLNKNDSTCLIIKLQCWEQLPSADELKQKNKFGKIIGVARKYKAFAERQREYVDKAKAHNVRNDAYEDDEVVIYETPLLINDNQRRLQFQALDNEVEYNESLIAEREGEIREIEQGFRNTSIRTTIDVSFKAIASTCPNHHEEVYLVGWEGEPQPISLSTGTSRGTVPGLRAGCSSNHQYFREVFHLALTQVSLFELE
ncbi:hypothetical protein C2G38_2149416 [Gigaspora rosea]|uniref:Uncharacterized protein n=1 Tax=Gigaspora rosea TaxID=44941 RepID=A0A397U3D4_9GLOM|nr:hypothetical protein C2G38_2149416 [Gigaspora rosea]